MSRLGVVFLIWLLVVAPAAPAVDRVVVVGDVHGDYERFKEVLRMSGVVDAKGKWSGGKAHLVQMGDVVDRGPDSKKVLDLIPELANQARRAGGQVHALIGNHEAMNIYGDLRYVHPGEFAAFRTSNSAEIRDNFFQQFAEANGKKPDRAKWDAEHPLGWFEHRYEFGPKGKYGKWIRGNPAMLKLDDTLFVHAGISPKYADFTIEAVNQRVREELEDFAKLEGGMVMDQEGPLWYRGLADGSERELETHLAAVLQFHGVKRIVVGHTVNPGAVGARFGARVILADVGLSQSYGGPPACVVIEQGKPLALHRGGKLELPEGSGSGLLRYLRQAAALDPKPSPLEPRIAALEGAQRAAAASAVR